MSLVGNLEDLGLGDILQIVSLSRKSGVLLLHSQGREGKIIFNNGQVIRATSTVFRENLGDLLVRRGIVDVDTIRQALLLQRNAPPPSPRIGSILIEQFKVPRETIDTVVREQIEKIVYSFFAWSEGTFSFELGDPEESAATSFNPLLFMLDQGLNPQWLAMEGSRLLDEKRHRGESLEEENSEPLIDVDSLLGLEGETQAVESAPAVAEATAMVPPSGGRPLLLVDDDEVSRNELARVLQNRGFDVTGCAAASEFLRRVAAMVQSGQEPLLVVDLIMPRLDGSGILGGLELLERLRSEHPTLPVLLITDHPNDEADRRLAEYGLPPVLLKPKKAEVRDQRGTKALEKLAESLCEFFTAPVASQGQTINFGAELLREMGEKPEDSRPKGPESPGLYLLRGMLQELNNPGLGGGITLLVLRFASELMNRAVIFLVKDDEVVGLGQFGIESTSELADVRVRRMRIPRGDGSLFEQVLEACAPMKVKPGHGKWDSYLQEQLGGGSPTEIFLGPLLSEGKVVALLYGDNLPAATQIGDTEALEIFLSQAGLAMEKALLERRLRGREAAG